MRACPMIRAGLALMFVLITSGLLISCQKGRLLQSSTGKLTQAKVQTAVDKAFAGLKAQAAQRNYRFRETARAVVQGVQENPQNNSATANVAYIDAEFQVLGVLRQTVKLNAGQAILTHYNDGRWVLTELRTDDIVYISYYRTSIEVQ